MPTLVVHERRSRCPLWWCTSDTADAHNMLVHEQANSTIQVGMQPMPTLVVHERHSRCPPYAGARASLVRYRLVYSRCPLWWCTSDTADAHHMLVHEQACSTIQVGIQPMPTLVVHERHSRCPHWWCTSDTADAHHMLVHEQANVTQPYGLVYTRLTLACLRSHFDEVLNPDMFILQAHAWPVRAGRSQCPLGVVKCHSNRSWR